MGAITKALKIQQLLEWRLSCVKTGIFFQIVQRCLYLLKWLFAERTAEVVVQAPLDAVFTESVTTGSSDWLEKQPLEDREKT